MIIINSESIARELLDKRSAIYSDRPVIPTNEMYVLLSSLVRAGELDGLHQRKLGTNTTI
jgi:hypothetical protein